MIKHLLIPALALILLSATITSSVTEEIVIQGNAKFAFDIFNQISSKSNDNIFISPFSISTALAMTYVGAAEKTEEEMKTTLHFGENSLDFHKAYSAYVQQLESNAAGNIQLSIANKIWTQKKYELKPQFITTNREAYLSEIAKMNFAEKPEESRLEINRWIEDKTKEKIKDLIPFGMITSDTRLVLTNAIYFKGDWANQFEKENTKDKPFYTLDNTETPIPFMHNRLELRYFERNEYQLVMLPYQGQKHSMVVVLPSKKSGIEKAAAMMSTNLFSDLAKSRQQDVIIELPKFKILQSVNLNEPLKELGMKQAFSEAANFSNMTKIDDDLHISAVLHKAFIEVDEKGTEAAAATAVIMTVECTIVSNPKLPVSFIANRPFLFYIIDNQTNAILFMGKMMNPDK
ncbi:MAG: serpin family protein [Bacteroidales bacterium]|nr:serpin family protein [Bacteroidales bacterium]